MQGNFSPAKQRIRIVLACGLLSIVMAIPVFAVTSVNKKSGDDLVAQCKTDLAKRNKLDLDSIKVAEQKSVTWPSSALGMPEIGKVYITRQTPGKRIVLANRNTKYLYTMDKKTFRYGGHVNLWNYSMLYTKSIQNEPNLNRELHQCSLLGTNDSILVSGVSEYYPQENGQVLFTRRTSRSGCELWFVDAKNPKSLKHLCSGFYIGEAAINTKQDTWAAIVRPSIGYTWMIFVGSLKSNQSDVQKISIPDDIDPTRIAWNEDGIIIQNKKENRAAYWENSLKATPSEWKPSVRYRFPGFDEFILSKSTSLEVIDSPDKNHPVVEVAETWFTGEKNVLATLDGLTLRGCNHIGQYVFVWGETKTGKAAYTVDISTGEVFAGYHGSCLDMKPFKFRPMNSPMEAK